ncbi:hypothetical protein SSX86_015563 [Deinandra increscens subsp. villosa]|uniref:Heat shock protein 70 n=1 Tax=Deinandra increscens subsp. villosa TaxID=3103831 RepID=A0AAP0GUU0_9ASTR
MSVIGFDIGNDSCVIAAAKRGGVDVLLNDESKRETPAVVSFGEKQRFLGSAGAAFATANPTSTISQIKRLIGKLYKEVEGDLKLLPFATSEGPRGGILIELQYLKTKWTFTPVEILGMLLKHLKQITEKNLESAVVDCVIGIPSYFTDLQRRMYLDAALIAGLKPLRLIHDGTAIALGYGMYKTDFSESGPTNVMFVDIGHCDTQVTLAAFEPGEMKILSHSFDPNLGGRDFDEVLFHHFAAQFNEKYKIDVKANARASVRLRASCEKVKKVLSANAEAPISIECLIGDTDVRGFITREEFEKLSSKLLDRVIIPCRMALKDADLSVDKISTVELVGSGSRIPAITRYLTMFFEKEPTRTLNASECVARGCALRCAMLSPSLKVRDYKIEDSFPYSIEIPSPKGEFMLFPKGSSFPKVTKMELQCNIPLCLPVAYINERNFPAGMSHLLGSFGIGMSEPSDAEKVDVELSVKLNNHGIVEIDSAKILEDKNNFARNLYARILMDNSRVLNLSISENLEYASTNDELREAKEKEKKLVQQDIKVEDAKDQRNTLESFVYDTRSKLSGAYRSHVKDSEKELITTNLQKTEDWLYEDSDDESEQDYTGRLISLKKLLEPIENRYNEEIAIAKATNSLKICIAKYHSHADSLPDDKKERVKKHCGEAEEWLRNTISQKHSSPKTLLTEINHVINVVESTCESIIRPKHSYPRNEEHVDSKRAREKAAKPLQTCITKYNLLAESLPAKMKEEVKNECREAEKWLVNALSQKGLPLKTLSTNINHNTKIFESNCERIINSKHSYSRKEEHVDSKSARENAAKPLQTCIRKYNLLADSLPADKKEEVKLVCREAEQWLVNAVSRKGLSLKTLSSDINHNVKIVESNCESIISSVSSYSKNEEHVESTIAREKAAKPLQTCIAKYNLLADSLPAEKKEEVKNECREAEQWLVNAVSQKGSSLKTLSYSINQYIKYVESKCENIISSASSLQRHEGPMDSDLRNRTVELDQKDHSMDSENATKALEACIAKYHSLAESLPANIKTKVKGECMRTEEWLVSQNASSPNLYVAYINHVIEGFQRNCESIIRSKASPPRHDGHGDLNEGDQRIVADHTYQPVNSDQTGQPMDMEQTGQPMDTEQTGQPMESDESGPLYNIQSINQSF